MSALVAALVEFQRSPGRFPVKLRQPEILFGSIKQVLQLASGRGVDVADDPPDASVQSAACFFVRQTLLHVDADHYELFGLGPSADPAAIKDRYRLLMRLIHPDFASGSAAGWPGDAAVRVNRAYEILGDAGRRATYDEELRRTSAAPVIQAIEPRPRSRESHAAPTVWTPRSRLGRLATIFGGVGVLGLAGILFLGGAPDGDELVQQEAGDSPAVAGSAGRLAGLGSGGGRSGVSSDRASRSGTGEANQGKTAAAGAARTSILPAAIARFFTSNPAPKEPREVPVAAAPAELTPRVNTGAVTPPALEGSLSSPPAPPMGLAAPTAPLPVVTALALPTIATAPVVPPTPVAEPVRVPVPRPVPVTAAAAPSSPPAAQPQAAVQAFVPPSREQSRVEVSRAAPPPAAPPVASPPALTLAQAQPLLASLLHQMESGGGERLLMLLDRDARNSPSAQALSRHYNSLVEEARPIKLAQVQFRAEPKEGRLIVTGLVRLQVGEPSIAASPKELQVVAEFASRDGRVVMTSLGRGGLN